MRTRFRGITVREGVLLRGDGRLGGVEPVPGVRRRRGARPGCAAPRRPPPATGPPPLRDSVPGQRHRAGGRARAGAPDRRRAAAAAPPRSRSPSPAAARRRRGPGRGGARRARPGGRIRVDANGAWDVDDAVAAIAAAGPGRRRPGVRRAAVRRASRTWPRVRRARRRADRRRRVDPPGRRPLPGPRPRGRRHRRAQGAAARRRARLPADRRGHRAAGRGVVGAGDLGRHRGRAWRWPRRCRSCRTPAGWRPVQLLTDDVVDRPAAAGRRRAARAACRTVDAGGARPAGRAARAGSRTGRPGWPRCGRCGRIGARERPVDRRWRARVVDRAGRARASPRSCSRRARATPRSSFAVYDAAAGRPAPAAHPGRRADGRVPRPRAGQGRRAGPPWSAPPARRSPTCTRRCSRPRTPACRWSRSPPTGRPGCAAPAPTRPPTRSASSARWCPHRRPRLRRRGGRADRARRWATGRCTSTCSSTSRWCREPLGDLPSLAVDESERPRDRASARPCPRSTLSRSGPRTVVVAGDDAGPPARVLAEHGRLAAARRAHQRLAHRRRTRCAATGCCSTATLGAEVERVVVLRPPDAVAPGHPAARRARTSRCSRSPTRGAWTRAAVPGRPSAVDGRPVVDGARRPRLAASEWQAADADGGPPARRAARRRARPDAARGRRRRGRARCPPAGCWSSAPPARSATST